MKKLFVLFMLAVMLVFRLPVTAESTEYVRDDYGILTQEELDALSSHAKEVSEKHDIGVYIRMSEGMGGYSEIADYTASLYSNEDLGLGDDRSAVIFNIAFEAGYVDLQSFGEKAQNAVNAANGDRIIDELLDGLNDGDFRSALDLYITRCDELMADAQQAPLLIATPEPTEQPVQETPEPLVTDNTEFVRDEYGILSDSEVASLNAAAQSIADRYDCGVYVRVFRDARGYGDNIEDFAEFIYKDEDLGIGTDRNGIMFIIEFDGRNFDLCAYGDIANRAFTDYGKGEILEATVGDLSNAKYYRSFKTYMDYAENYLYAEANGSPVDTWIPDIQPVDPEQRRKEAWSICTMIAAILSPLVSLLTCLGLRSRNHTEHIATTADKYIARDGIDIRVRQDRFLRKTETRTPIQRDNSSGGGGGHFGGTSVNSGGFSHSSGKF